MNLLRSVLCFLLLGSTLSGYAHNDHSEKLDSLRSNYELANSDSLRVIALMQLSAELEKVDINQAVEKAQLAYSFHPNVDDTLTSKACVRLGIVFAEQGRYDSSLVYFEKAYQYFTTSNQPSNAAKVLTNIGTVQFIRGKLNEALANYKVLLELKRETGDKDGVGLVLTNIGSVYNRLRDYETALEYYQKALNVMEEEKDHLHSPLTLINVGEIYINIDSFDLAYQHLNQAVEIYSERQNVEGQAKGLYLIAKMRNAEGKTKEAIEIIHESISLFQSIGKTPDVIFNQIFLAQCQLANNQLEAATNSIDEAFRLSLNIADENQQRDIYRVKYYIAKAKEDYSKALMYYELYQELSDSILSAENKRELVNLRGELELSEKASQINQLENEKALMELEAEKNAYWNTLISLIVILVLIVLILIIYGNYKRRAVNAQLRELSIVAQNTDNYVIITDRDDKISWVNPSFTQITGFSLEDVRGKQPSSVLLDMETTEENVRAINEHLVTKKTSWSGELRHRNIKGDMYWARVVITPVVIDGRIEKSISIGVDINESKTTSEKLKASEEKLRQIFENSYDGIFMLDPRAGIIVDVNRRACEMLEYDKEELRYMPMAQVHPKEMKELTTFFNEVSVNGQGFTSELTCTTSAGKSFPSEITAAMIKVDGKSYVLAIVRDIRERLEAEKEIRRANTILKGVKNIVLVANEEGKITYVNRYTSEVLGFEREELLGNGWYEKIGKVGFEKHAAIQHRAMQARGELIVSDEPYESLLKTKSGKELYFLWRDALGPGNTVIGVGQNVTEMRRHQALIEEKNRELTSSINYARKIQQAQLPNLDQLNKYYNDHFVFYLPKDIVSGDFYWQREVNGTLVLAMADCTGHGVPGGFLTMLGMSQLNAIVNDANKCKPATILTELNEGIQAALSSDQQDSQINEGMDITILSYNKLSGKFYFSGARRSLWLLAGKEVQEFSGVRASIGESLVAEKAFVTTEVSIEKGQRLYLFSDGITDQYDAYDQRKFSCERFKELLKWSSELTMIEQRRLIKQNLVEWMGETPQTDDILVVGLEV